MKKTIYIIIFIITILIGTTINRPIYARHTTGEVIREADGFISAGKANSTDIISTEELQDLSDTIYTILVVVGVVIAIIVGAMLGIKFITEGVEGKAEVQKALIAYVIGCVVIFGAFIIWRIVVNILQGIE